MNLENQQLLPEKLSFVREMAGFAQTLSSDEKLDKRALMKLFGNLANDIAFIEEPKLIEIHSDSVAAAFRSNRTSKSGLPAKDSRKAI